MDFPLFRRRNDLPSVGNRKSVSVDDCFYVLAGGNLNYGRDLNTTFKGRGIALHISTAAMSEGVEAERARLCAGYNKENV